MTPDGRIGHVEVALGDSVLMITEEWPEDGLLAPVRRGGASLSLRLETPDPDGVVAAALAAGATLERPVTDEPYGARRGGRGRRRAPVDRVPRGARGAARRRDLRVAVGAGRRPHPSVLRRRARRPWSRSARPRPHAATLMCCYEVADVDAAVTVVRAAGGTRRRSRATSRTGAPRTASTTRASRSRCTPGRARRRWPGR